MKPVNLKFYTRTTIIALLGTIGLLAITGEPAEDAPFLATFACQVAVWAATWLAAYALAKHWHITEIINRLHYFNHA